MKHPLQKIIIDSDGRARFQSNAIVETLLAFGPLDMNKLAVMEFDDGDREQFAQLIGYSISGFCELSYVTEEAADAASDAQDDTILIDDESSLVAIENITRDQRGLLLYAETCCVDWSGLLEDQRMNKDDMDALKFWHVNGALTFGRVPMRYLKATGRTCSHWVTLTAKGWKIASQLRQQRSLVTGRVRKEIDEALAEKSVQSAG